MLATARRHAVTREKVGDAEVQRLKDRFGIDVGDLQPRVYWRVTPDWLELAVRYLAADHGGRSIKDAMTRDIMAGLESSNVEIGATRQEAVPPRVS